MIHLSTRNLFVIFLLSLISVNSYADIPAGYYYFANKKKGTELKTSLSVISYPVFVYSYGGGADRTWEGFFQTDQLEGGLVYDMYSSEKRYFDGFSAVAGMNIEHSLPKSWWGGIENSAYKDLFHLYPSDAAANNVKSNLPLGEVTGTATFNNGVSKIGKNGYGSAYAGNCFEPADEFKGDFARSYFYVSTIYQDLADKWNSPMMDNNIYPVWQPWAIQLLLKWHSEDPVSEKERQRNEIIYDIQGNRNPFIDYPDLVDYIWGSNTNNTYPFPEETKPFLAYPRIGTTMDLGVIMQNSNTTQDIELLGVNLESDVTLSLKVNQLFSISSAVVSNQSALDGTTLSVAFNPTIPGIAFDTLVISSQNMKEVLVPITGIASSDFITTEPNQITPVGATLHWTAVNGVTDYLVSLYQGDTKAGDLIISGYVEGTSNNKGLEIYNGTGSVVDLSNYSLRRQHNGIGVFTNELILSGELTHNATYSIVNGQASLSGFVDKADLIDNNITAFNGNDAIALYRNGIMIDMVGVKNDPAMWGENKTFERKAFVTHPTTDFKQTEWEEYSSDYISNIGSHQMDLSEASTHVFENRSVGTDNYYLVDELTPNQYYTYSISAVLPSGTISSVNTSQVHTLELDAPEVLEATNVDETSFTANWESNPYTDNHLLNVFQLQGEGSKTDVFDFNSVGSNGQPLPSGWTGTASGNYSTSTSTGKSPNSIALKNNGEYLQTNVYELPITQLNFMYRFPSSGTGNILKLEIYNGSAWEELISYEFKNTNKTYPELTFAPSKNVKAIKFTFYKSSGNLAIDDVEITHGAADTLYIEQNTLVSDNQYHVYNLTPATTYHYHVKATKQDYSSSLSDVMEVKTLEPGTGIESNELNEQVTIMNVSGGIEINGVPEGAMIGLYHVDGTLNMKLKSVSSNLFIPLNQSGIYLIKIDGCNTAFKIIK